MQWKDTKKKLIRYRKVFTEGGGVDLSGYFGWNDSRERKYQDEMSLQPHRGGWDGGGGSGKFAEISWIGIFFIPSLV